MAFALVAELPLGTYRAHLGRDAVDPLPSAARLHAALLCAAAAGTRAADSGGTLGPRGADMAALTWLEENPPSGIAVPVAQRNWPRGQAYRDIGKLHKSTIKKPPKPVGDAVALAGPVAWVWAQDPPLDVRESLSGLCHDVSHLGTSESPVRLTIGDVDPTHVLDEEADLFTGSGLDLETPTAGRTRELLDTYSSTLTPPSAARDRVKTDEDDLLVPPPRKHVGPVRYREPEQPDSTAVAFPAPWSDVLLLPLDQPISADVQVRWAVAVHGALIKLVGFGAPPGLTGAYAPGQHRPANRVAIQFLPQAGYRGCTGAAATLAVMLPAGAATSDLEPVVRAVHALSSVRGPGGALRRRVAAVTTCRADAFWNPVPENAERVFVTHPAAVPEARRRPGAMTLSDAAVLSAALVWRDELGGPGRGSGWYDRMVAAGVAAGVEVEALHRVTDGDPTRFVHRVPEGLVVEPYYARLALGRLAGPRTLVAIGQSRHLGGGLLVPVDRAPSEGPTR